MSADGATSGQAEIDFFVIGLSLLGGLAVFLIGMDRMSDALKAVAGDAMRNVLARLTTNRFTGALTGAFVTAVIQSSSVTTVLLVGFVSAGLMTLSQSVGVIMGANVGTTVTAQIIAFKVTDYALGLVALGFALNTFSRRETLRSVGTIVLGLGLIFLGMEIMAQATTPLRTYEPFTALMARIEHPLLAMLVAAAFTALVQSSSATTGLVIAFASVGLITLDGGIALIIGANIGTCITAILAAIGKPRAAIQVAAVHVVFNVAGALLWLWFIPSLAEFARDISPANPDLEGTARLAAEVPRQVANAHTIFNVANTAIFIWLTTPIAALVKKIIPDPPPEEDPSIPVYLNDGALETPAIALESMQREVARLGELSATALAAAIDRGEPETDWALVGRRVRAARGLYESILGYAQQLVTTNLSSRQASRIERLLMAAGSYNALAETVGLNLDSLGRQWEAAGLVASDETAKALRALQSTLDRGIAESITAVSTWDRAAAERVIDLKPEILERVAAVEHHLARRLLEHDPGRLAKHRLETGVVELLKRIYSIVRRIAKAIVAETEVDRGDMSMGEVELEDPTPTPAGVGEHHEPRSPPRDETAG